MDNDKISRWADALKRPAVLRFLHTDDPRSRDFERFCLEFSRLVPKIGIRKEEGERGGPPALVLDGSWRYHLIPSGNELDPFLEIIKRMDSGESGLSESVERALENVINPADIMVFVTPYCPHCRAVVSKIIPLPMVRPELRITIVDGLLFPEMAKASRIRSVPTVLCDGKFRWTGPVEIEEILEVISGPDPGEFGEDLLKRMIKEGEAGTLADMMIRKGRVSRSLLGPLTDPDLSLRLGAMVVMEEIASQRPDLARRFLNLIWPLMGRMEDTVKGDMIYLYGELGDRTWIPALMNLQAGRGSDELGEAIAEAVEKLKSRE